MGGKARKEGGVTRRLHITDNAFDDLGEIAEFIAEQSGSRAVADAHQDRLLSRIARLADLPGTLGTARPDVRADLRSVPHKGYVIFFRYTNDAVEIVNVLHASRDVIAYYRDEGPESD